jgi:hypothetical protein
MGLLMESWGGGVRGSALQPATLRPLSYPIGFRLCNISPCVSLPPPARHGPHGMHVFSLVSLGQTSSRAPSGLRRVCNCSWPAPCCCGMFAKLEILHSCGVLTIIVSKHCSAHCTWPTWLAHATKSQTTRIGAFSSFSCYFSMFDSSRVLLAGIPLASRCGACWTPKSKPGKL